MRFSNQSLLYRRIILLLVILIVGANFSCNDQVRKKTKQSVQGNIRGISSESFGRIDSTNIIQYTLVNETGMQVRILNYGATITSIVVPDRDGKSGDVVLGYDSLKGYLQKDNPYMGALVGRYGNRIAHAQFMLDGKTYSLAANNGLNTLHGGIKGFDKVIWNASPLPGDSIISLRMQYLSRDGEEGFPGNCKITVVYSITPDNELKIEYWATTDKATPINLTNHSYFNLSAGLDSTILAHEITINANRFTAVNSELIPTGKIEDVRRTPMDFTKMKFIGSDISKVKGGYDHNYVLNKNDSDQSAAVSVYDSLSGRTLEMFTTEPGVQFYSGNFLDGKLAGKNGIHYVQHAGFCLEAQHYPNSPNQPSFPNVILRPGEEYHQLTIYKFSAK
jgi:aldose 1-epimerase